MVMITLEAIKVSLEKLGIDTGNIDRAIAELQDILPKLDEVEVKGRENLNILLGCMIAIEKVLGGEERG